MFGLNLYEALNLHLLFCIRALQALFAKFLCYSEPKILYITSRRFVTSSLVTCHFDIQSAQELDTVHTHQGEAAGDVGGDSHDISFRVQCSVPHRDGGIEGLVGIIIITRITTAIIARSTQIKF